MIASDLAVIVFKPDELYVETYPIINCEKRVCAAREKPSWPNNEAAGFYSKYQFYLFPNAFSTPLQCNSDINYTDRSGELSMFVASLIVYTFKRL